jgi:ribosomal protein S18 acetylase RimI-like enzyme
MLEEGKMKPRSKHTLKDGREVEIVPLSAKVPAKWLLEYINALIGEDVYLSNDTRFTLKQEEEWKKDTLGRIRKGEKLYISAIYGKRIVGGCTAIRGAGRTRGNVMLGIAISRDFRRVGLGERMMEEIISLAKKKFKPKNICLSVAAPNKSAQKLYRKLGFVEMARFPRWVEKGGRHYEVIWMILGG